MIPDQYKLVTSSPVIIDKHTIIGASSVILPGVHLHTGVAIGAMSLVKQSCDEFTMYAGVPAKKLKNEVENY